MQLGLLSEIQKAVAAHQRELRVATSGGLVTLSGLFVVSGPQGPFDSYEVRVAVTRDFPWEEPVVIEVGDRIPRVADRHIYPEHGTCCLGVWEEWLLTAPDRSFETFLTGIMHDYFVSQSYYEANDVWPFGERSHGDAGVRESYADLLGIANDPVIIVDHLRILSMNDVKGHHPCPCGSGQKLRHCHRNKVDGLKDRIPLDVARRMFERLSPKKRAA